MPLISVLDLSMKFGSQRALDGLKFDVHSGVTGLVGANGAGKTTFMSLVLGLRSPTSGSLTVLGMDPIKDGSKLRSMVSYGPERNVLPDEMPAIDFVKHLSEVRGMPRKEAKGRASDVLWLVGLGEERFRPLGTMSTGQRQRVKLAQAISADPKLVLLDEPTDGLDPIARDEILDLIRQIGSEYEINVILSSHLMEEVERICDNIIVLNAGELVTAGPLQNLTGDTGHLEVEFVEIDERPEAITQVAESLRAAGVDVIQNTENQVLQLISEDGEVLADLLRDAIADSGGRVHRIEQGRRSLEDLFEDSEP